MREIEIFIQSSKELINNYLIWIFIATLGVSIYCSARGDKLEWLGFFGYCFNKTFGKYLNKLAKKK